MSGHGRLSLRHGFVWNFFGTSLYNLARWLLLVLLARLSSPEEVGHFALLLAVSAPVFLTAGMNLRMVQATDAVGRWRLEDYLLLRHLLNVVAWLSTMAVGFVMGLAPTLLAALAALAAAKSVENMSLTYYGLFQQSERHDLVAQSMIARSLTGPLGFTLGFLVLDDLTGACLGLLVGWSVPQVLFDRRRARELRVSEGAVIEPLLPARWADVRALARKSWPVGLDQGVSSLAVNIPRYVVDAVLGAAQLGIYSTLAYLAQVISMVTSALGLVVVPRLSQYHRDGRGGAFVRLLALQSGFSVAVVVVSIGGAAIVGEPFVRMVLGEEYVDQRLLIALLVGAGAVTLQRSVGRGLAGAQRFVSFLAVDTVTAVGVGLAAIVIVPRMGLIGAAWATAAGFTLGAVACLIPVIQVVRGIGTDDAARDSIPADAGR